MRDGVDHMAKKKGSAEVVERNGVGAEGQQ